MLFGAVVGSSFSTASEDQLLFISSDDCQACSDLQPHAKEAADVLGIRFIEGKFSRVVPFPGYILVSNGIVDIVGFNSQEVLFQSLCDLTQDVEVCERYAQINAMNNQTTG